MLKITEREFEAIALLMDFINHPGWFGCSINLGAEETYERRVGSLFEDATAAIEAVKNRK